MAKYVLTAEQKQHQINCNNVRKTDLINRIANRTIELLQEVETIEENDIDMYKNEYVEQLQEKTHNEYLRLFIGYMIENGNKKAIKIMKMIIKYNSLCKVVVE